MEADGAGGSSRKSSPCTGFQAYFGHFGLVHHVMWEFPPHSGHTFTKSLTAMRLSFSSEVKSSPSVPPFSLFAKCQHRVHYTCFLRERIEGVFFRQFNQREDKGNEVALALFADLAQNLCSRAEAEARQYLKTASPKERRERVVATAHENLRRSRFLWYKVRDAMVTGNNVFFSRNTDAGEEKCYAPQSATALSPWFAEHFLEGQTFFIERAGSGRVDELGTAHPVHIS